MSGPISRASALVAAAACSLLLCACGGDSRAREAGQARFAAARHEYESEIARALGTSGTVGTPTPSPSTDSTTGPPGATAEPDARVSAEAGGSALPGARSGASALAPGAAPAAMAGTAASGAALSAAAGVATPVPGSAGSAGPRSMGAVPGSTPQSFRPGSRGGGGPRFAGSVGSLGMGDAALGAGIGGSPAPDGAATPAAGASPDPMNGAASPTPTPAPDSDASPTPSPTPKPTEPPDSDSEPPRVVSIVFDPSTTPDSSRVAMTVVAKDNKSGTDYAEGAVTGPSARAKVYFKLTPDPAGVALTGTFKVPPEAEAGVWSILSLSLTDKARNTAQYTAANDPIVATAHFTVQSAGSDSDPPTLDSVFVSPSEARDNAAVKVIVRASDAKSTVQSVRGALSSPSGIALPFNCFLNRSTGSFEASVTIPPHAENGDWYVSLIVAIDSAKNRLTVNAPDERLAGARVKITSQEDKTPPRLVSIQVAPPVASPDGIVNIDVTASDDLSGVKAVAATLQMGSSPSPLPVAFQRFAPGIYHVTVTIPKQPARGLWLVSSLTITDYAMNSVTLPASDPIVATAVWEVK